MNYRVTSQIATNSAIRQAQHRQAEIAKLQDQLSSGLRISKPSDAPGEWSTLVSRKASIERMDVELENVEVVRRGLNQSVSNLTEAGNFLVRARELALASHQSQNRETLAQEVDLLIDGLLEVANTATTGVQHYGGTASSHQPFVVTARDQDGRPTRIEYQGSNDSSLAAVSQYGIAEALSPGSNVFQQTDRQPTQYIGDTGVTAGVGTDNARGTETLIVQHTQTTYSSPNVLPGASSADGDTIIGPPGAHILTIGNDPDLGRVVSLNGGGWQPFDASSVDLKVVGSLGQHVHVDLSNVPAGFVGDVDIEATGTIELDGNSVPIDFTQSQILSHQDGETVTVVDTTQIRQTGTERIEYAGTNGVFESLIQLRDDLRNADEWSTDEFITIMSARLNDVERAHNQIMGFVGEQAVELANLDRLENKTRELKLAAQEAVADTESADVADVITRLQNEQLHLQFIYGVTATLNQISLLDFIS